MEQASEASVSKILQYIFFVPPAVRVQRVLDMSKILYHFLPPIGRFLVPQISPDSSAPAFAYLPLNIRALRMEAV